MSLDLASSRARAASRQALLVLLVALTLAAACLLVPAARWGQPTAVAPVPALGAPPEAATRPNPPTEPLRGVDEPAAAP